MPYLRTKRRFRKKSYKGYSKKSSLVTKNYLKNYLNKNVEFKYYDHDESTTVDSSGAVYSLTDIPQGDTDITRDGDKLILKNVQLRGTISLADASNAVRIIVFQWHPLDSASIPAVSAIIQYIGTYGIVSPYHHDGRTQFTVLSDKTYLVNNVSMPYMVFRQRVPLKYAKKQVAYTAGGSFGYNKIMYLAITDSGTTAHPLVSTQSRVYFTDA